jgi:hypothetical protein
MIEITLNIELIFKLQGGIMDSWRHHLPAFWNHLAGSALCDLIELFGNKIPLPHVAPVRQVRKGSQVREEYEPRDRIFNQWRTFWMFLGQVLSWTQSCNEALVKAQAWLWHSEKKKISSNTAGYCQGRNRLNQEYLNQINRDIIQQHQKHDSSLHLWCGRNVKGTDGSSFSMPDTKENQQLYPQPTSQKKGCGFPVMRIVATFSLASGVILDCRKGSLDVHERTLWREGWDSYEENDVVLADCGFCSYADYHLLKEKKVDSVMRLHQRRKEKKIIKKFNKNDYLVIWQKGKKSQRPKWLTEQQWNQLPNEMTVRYVKVSINIPGIRTKKFVVATTLLDPKKYPADAIAELYWRRWRCELFLKDIKTTMRMKVLRSRTPKMIHKEFTIFIIAYNLIRSLIWNAALDNGVDPNRISFKAAINVILQWAPILMTIKNRDEKIQCITTIKNIIANNLIPIRKIIRREPRAIKRRQNANYQLLTKPRKQFKEIPHREKYRKDVALS